MWSSMCGVASMILMVCYFTVVVLVVMRRSGQRSIRFVEGMIVGCARLVLVGGSRED